MHLRVWWNETKETFFTNGREAGSGIVIGSNGQYCNFFFVRKDDGEMLRLLMEEVVKSKWVSHPDDGEE